MPPRRILQAAQMLKLGGAEKILIDVAAALNKEKYQSAICAFKGGEREEDCHCLGIDLEIIEKTKYLNFIFFMKIMVFLIKKKIDLVHCHGAATTVYCGTAAKLLGLPVVITVHGKNAYRLRSGVKALQYAQKLGATVVAVSGEIKSEMVHKLGLREDTISVITNGIAPGKTHVYGKDSILRKKRELSVTSSLLIGSVGTLREVKGHQYLLMAMPEIIKKYPDLKLIIVGDGELRKELETLADDLGIDNHVVFAGQRRDIVPLMAIFDIVVQPSLTEGISVVILEAMSASKPVVATNVGGNTTLIKNLKNGLLVLPKDVVSLSDAVISLLDNKELRVRMGKDGFEQVQKNFSMERMVSEYESIYKRLLKKSGRIPAMP